MPDIIIEGDTQEIVFWPDELCSSCTVQESCALLAAIKGQAIQTYDGFHVFRCVLYVGDQEAATYVAPEIRDPMAEFSAAEQALLDEIQAVQRSLRLRR